MTIELLDSEKEYLSSFGGEFWQYAGVDNEGYHWEEGDDTYEAGVRIPSPGTYYLQLETESNVEPSQLSPISVTLSEQTRWGAPTPLQAAGYVTFFLGLILVIIRRGTSADALELQKENEIRFRDETWIVRDRADYDYDDWKSEEWTLHSTEPGAKAPRYLEREYEDDSPYEAWFWSTPVSLSDLTCAEEESEPHVEAYVAAHEALPEMIIYEDERLRLNNSGTALRNDDTISYHTYQELWKEDGDLSVTIEGDPPEDLSAVVTERIHASDLQRVEKEDSQSGTDGDNVEGSEGAQA